MLYYGVLCIVLTSLAVEQKNRAHKIYAVAHHINLHAQTLQI